jgi:hypothetical protein
MIDRADRSSATGMRRERLREQIGALHGLKRYRCS